MLNTGNIKKKVVVTGIGIINSLGGDKETVWQSLISGKNGIRLLRGSVEKYRENGISAGGYIEDNYLNKSSFALPHKKLLKDYNRVTSMCIYAGLNALKDGKVNIPVDSNHLSIGAIHSVGTYFEDDYLCGEYEKSNPTWFLKTYPNIHLSYLSIITGLTGHCSTIVNACEGGTQAIGNAFKMIQNGTHDIMLAGGTDSKFSHLYISGFSRLNMLNRGNDPLTAMRPFDKERKGFILGEGSCFLLLESLEHANKRDVKPYCEIVGYGNAADSFRLTDASSNGKYRSMYNALIDAGLTPHHIDYINAHGTSTYSNDKEESIAIKKMLGEHAYKIPVNSTKSMTGHTFAASGTIESSICVMSLLKQRVHVTKNFSEGDEYCDLNYVKDTSQRCNIRYCLKNSSGVGGFNSSLILKAID